MLVTRTRSKLLRAGAVVGAVALGLLAVGIQEVGAQTTTTTIPVIPPASAVTSKTVSVFLGIPFSQIPLNVTGFRVDFLCLNSPGTFDGVWNGTATAFSTGTTITASIPYNATTYCNVRLTVTGTGSRPLILTSNSVDAANVGFRYLDVVDGITVDPQTVIEIGPLLVKDLNTVRFGTQAPVTTTTTTTAPTTTTAAPTTTVAPATTSAPTTTQPPAPVVAKPPVATTTTVKKTRLVKVCARRVRGRCTKYVYVRR